MQQKQEGVQPVFGSRTVSPVHVFVFCDKQAGEKGKCRKNHEVRSIRVHQKRPCEAGENRKGVEGVTDSFPAWQTASSVEPEFINGHTDHLQNKWNNKPIRTQHFRNNAPAIVSPGPKARLTRSVPGLILASCTAAIQMWGRVADDMFPLWKRTALLA